MKKVILISLVSMFLMSCGSASTEAPTTCDSTCVKDSCIKVDTIKAK